MSLPFVARSAGNIYLWRRLVASAFAALLCTSAAWADGISGAVGGPVGLWVNTNNEALYITTSGNVGIGTTVPLAGLDSRGVIGNTIAIFGYSTNGVSLTEDYPGLDFNTYYNGGYIYMGTGYAGYIQQNPSTGEIALYISSTSGTAGGTVSSFITPLSISASGDVGIGSTSPQSPLDTNGYIRTTGGAGTPSSGSDLDFAFVSGTGYIEAYNYTGSAYLPLNITGNPTTLAGTVDITANAVLSGTTTFTGAINATDLSSGTVASGKYIGLNTSNQLVLGNGGSASSLALSALTSAQATNSEDNVAYAQTWTWNSLSTQTGLTISTSSAFTGTLVALSGTAASATSTGFVLTVSNTTTGKGFGGYFTMTGSGNSGNAGYFSNTATGATGYAIYTAGNNYLGGTTTIVGAFNTTSTNVLGGTTTITGTLNQTGNAVLSGTTTISTGALNITSNTILSGTTTISTGALNIASNAILSGTTTFTGAMNRRGSRAGRSPAASI